MYYTSLFTVSLTKVFNYICKDFSVENFNNKEEFFYNTEAIIPKKDMELYIFAQELVIPDDESISSLYKAHKNITPYVLGDCFRNMIIKISENEYEFDSNFITLKNNENYKLKAKSSSITGANSSLKSENMDLLIDELLNKYKG